MNRYEALKHAVIAHAGQVDKCGKPYILHPMAVAGAIERSPTYQERRTDSGLEITVVVALLHDVYEDAPPMLRPAEREFKDPFSWPALAAVSKDENEPYAAYIERVCSNNIACIVKLADLWHNLSPERQDCLPEKERRGLEKRYLKARDRIWEALGYRWWPDPLEGES